MLLFLNLFRFKVNAIYRYYMFNFYELNQDHGNVLWHKTLLLRFIGFSRLIDRLLAGD